MTIVDDTYNASPGSVLAALELLAGLPGRRIAVLGEMLELGDEQRGRPSSGRSRPPAASSTCSSSSATGAAGIAEGAREAGLAPSRDRRRRRPRGGARRSSADGSEPGDVVLVKASRGIELEVLVDDLRAALGPVSDR